MSVPLPLWWPADLNSPLPLIRPPALVALEGMTTQQGKLLALDRIRGYLVQIEPLTQTYRLINPSLTPILQDTYGLASDGNALWLAKEKQVFRVPWHQLPYLTSLVPFQVWLAPYPIEALAVAPERIYASCYQREKILVLDPKSGTQILEWPAPGIGREQLCVQDDYLWVSDRIEESLFVLNRHTGQVLAAMLSPYPAPTGLTFYQGQLLIASAGQEPFIRDSPNDLDPLSVDYQDKTLIVPLRLRTPHAPPQPPVPVSAQSVACPLNFFPQIQGERAMYTLSGGYRVEMIYLEEIAPHEPVVVPNLIWQIALPCTSLRQRVIDIAPVGLPFELLPVDGQQVAEFHLGTLQPHDGCIFGWRAVLDLYSIKYHLVPDDVEDAVIPAELASRYLIDDDDLAMDHPLVQQAARIAVGTETNLLRKVSAIRDYVYDQLVYRVIPRIETPDVVLQKHEGSCGEYVGVLLALMRLNGIPCRTVGRYKCPATPEMIGIPTSPQYNHVWIEFYVPGWGWLPMESNPDDLGERPYPRRYLMGLPWTHAEIAKGIPFESCNNRDFSIGELAINHVQFRIIKTL